MQLTLHTLAVQKKIYPCTRITGAAPSQPYFIFHGFGVQLPEVFTKTIASLSSAGIFLFGIIIGTISLHSLFKGRF